MQSSTLTDLELSQDPLGLALAKSYREKELEAAAKLEADKNAVIEYWIHFNKLKKFQEDYCQELPELLRILHNEDNVNILKSKTWKTPFLTLMKSLADLSELCSNDTPLPLRQALIEGICLTEYFTKVKSGNFPKDAEEKILSQMAALTANIEALAQFSQNPHDESYKRKLTEATEETISTYDGYYRIHENRALFRFLGVVNLMLCIAACVISSILMPQTAGLVPILTFITTGLLGMSSIGLLYATTQTLSQNQDNAFLFRAKVKEYCFFPSRPAVQPQPDAKLEEQSQRTHTMEVT